MSSLSNAEISRLYQVSKPTVAKWIDDAMIAKNLLKIVKVGDKNQISDIEHNHIELRRLREDGRKHRSYSSLKRVEISEEFYKIFNEDQALEIANDLEYHNLVNLKYCYKNGGAEYWDKYYNEEANQLSRSVESILNNNLQMVDFHLGKKKVNLLELGCGNGLPLIELIKYLSLNDKLVKYEAFDISEDILAIAKSNINHFFPNLQTELNVIDLEIGSYSNKFLQERNSADVNLIALFGNTVNNFDDRILVLKNIAKGMVPNDVFLITFSLDNGKASRELSYAKDKYAELHEEWLLNLLGFDVDQCEVPLYWDESLKLKTKTLKLDKDYELKFKIFGTERVVYLNESTEINRWKHYVLSMSEVLSEIEMSGLKVISMQLDSSKSNAMILCEVKN